MHKILHIHASPRPESYSLRLAKAFLNAFMKGQSDYGCETIDLFDDGLPEFDAPAAAAKYSVMRGVEPQDEAAEVWLHVTDCITKFKSADMYVISSPMWNFGIPYRLKQYFDIIVQPGLTFAYAPGEGYRGLVTDRPAVLLLARGGAYPNGTVNAQYDMQKPYLEAILRYIGFTDIRTVVLDKTLSVGVEVVEAEVQKALAQAIELARQMAGEMQSVSTAS